MKRAAIAVAVAVVLLVGVVALRYDVRDGTVRGARVTIRIDRFGGAPQYLSPTGWKPLREIASDPSGLDPDIAAALDKR